MKKIAVAILNYNGQKFLEQFLPSVIQYSQEADIIVIDNASTDTSMHFLHHNYPSVQTIPLDKNYGFAEGYNLGLAQINNPYFLLLNSDVEVSPNWLQPLIDLAESNASIAAIQPKILSYKHKENFEYAGAAGGFMDYLGYPFCRGRIFSEVEKDQQQYNEISPIFWATGAALFVRAEVFKKLGGFDSAFFAHMEEIDLCWRIHNAGYEIYYQPNSKVYHVGGGTLKVQSSFKTYLNFRNNMAMLYKNLPPHKLWSTLFTRLCLDGVAGVQMFFSGQFKNVWAIIKAHFGFYGLIPYLKKHRATQFLGYNKLYAKSIVWKFYAQKKRKYSDL